MSRFVRYELRTTDVDAARAFYEAVLGAPPDDVSPLPEVVLARGGRSHWLGHLGVDDVERAVEAFVARGAERLGPTRTSSTGGDVAILRGVGGEIVAVATPPLPSTPVDGHLHLHLHVDVAWHVHLATDLASSRAAYHDVFGFATMGLVELSGHGFETFAFEAGEPTAGVMGAIGARPGVHPQWLFHFRVPSLDAAIAAVRARGGLALEPMTLPSGARVVACDDRQGAAFGLWEGEPR